MKRIKRIAAVVFLIVFLAFVGYPVYSGSRFFGQCDIENYRNAVFYANKEDVYLSVDAEMMTVYAMDGIENYLIFDGESDGVLAFTDGNQTFRFIATSDGSLYDIQKNIILYRSC